MRPSFSAVVAASADVAATRSRLAKTAILAGLLGQLSPDEQGIGISYLSGSPRQDVLGLGWASLERVTASAADAPSLTLTEVDAVLEEIAGVAGAGSTVRRDELLADLLELATESEQAFLHRLLLRDLRQGATEGMMIEAVGSAADVPSGLVRRAAMLTGSLVDAGVLALRQGATGLQAVGLSLMRPVQPMLASTAEDLESAMDQTGRASVEAKLDGARIQVHRSGDRIAIYTRNLNDITGRIPEVAERIAGIPGGDLILDGEVIAMDPGGRPHAFQVSMSRFGTQSEVEEQRGRRPLAPFFFDVLHMDGVDLLDRPAADRWERLSSLPSDVVVERLVTADVAAATAFMEATLAAGHEGVMVKSLDAPYAAGRRGAAWLKVKPVHTLDLVVVAVEWGSGRRKGWLSNLHLGARNPDGGFVMLGKTFKGMTDAMLEWQTARFLELETRRTKHVVHVRPEQVVEIAIDGVQTSTRYPGGLALRFARVKGYRGDKSADEADTIGAVRAIYERRPAH